ncbi:YwqG family protein [Lysinibacillus sp. LZ02]|uniref:YwqG family protein n=1 Tax=Lysinibacillus sp. LZ02 TaxID=3420668 RepID=UPI003D359BF4
MKFPAALASYRTKIEQTLDTVVRITLSAEETNRFSSKVGGYPYFLAEDAYPLGEDGQPLRLLTQINFAEIPQVLHDFPQQGILQFYIHPLDDVMGLDFDNGKSQKNFRVLYHEKIVDDESKLLTDFAFLETDEEQYGPLDFDCSYGMTFHVAEEPMTLSDFRFDQVIGIEDDSYELHDLYFEELETQGHKIGGYPYFTQADPREYGDYQEQLILLFQLDTDDDFDIMWGDVGVGNFFISKEDLIHKRFDRVLYNWDCH